MSEAGANVARFSVRLAGGVPAAARPAHSTGQRTARPVRPCDGHRRSHRTRTGRRQAHLSRLDIAQRPADCQGERFLSHRADRRRQGTHRPPRPRSRQPIRARWWLVDPEGKPLFDVGTDHVNYMRALVRGAGYAPYHRNVAAKFGSEEAWAARPSSGSGLGIQYAPRGAQSLAPPSRLAAHPLRRVWEPSFANGSGSASPSTGPGSRMSSARVGKRIAASWRGSWPRRSRRSVVPGNVSRQRIGVVRQEGATWSMRSFGLAPSGRPNRLFMHGCGGVMAVWKRSIAVSACNTPANMPFSPPLAPQGVGRSDEVRDGFLTEIAQRYFAVAATAMRQADPEHLVLGCRFAGRAPRPPCQRRGSTTTCSPSIPIRGWTSRASGSPTASAARSSNCRGN